MELRILAALLLGAFISCVTAISAQGSRLLVVLEDEAEKSKYGQFWLDLEGIFIHLFIHSIQTMLHHVMRSMTRC